jgi:hypothetical protein
MTPMTADDSGAFPHWEYAGGVFWHFVTAMTPMTAKFHDCLKQPPLYPTYTI